MKNHENRSQRWGASVFRVLKQLLRGDPCQRHGDADGDHASAVGAKPGCCGSRLERRWTGADFHGVRGLF